MIKYIVQIKESTGEIIRISFPQRDIPVEGVDVEKDLRTVYVTEETLPSPECNYLKHFIGEYWWVGNEFVHIGKKPNKHAVWNPESQSWVWEVDLMMNDIRQIRNGKLRSVDWTQLPDAPLTEEQKTVWQTYRQSLRDVPLNSIGVESLDEVVWPTEPL